MKLNNDHISVCICTYKRPEMLTHLLCELQHQKTDKLFTYSLTVVDNDYAESAKKIVETIMNESSIDIDYYCEPEQNIALARNKAVQNAHGNFVSFIDDDEIPSNDWLYTLYKAINEYKADGILGPVIPIFEETPPPWVVKGKFYEKPSHKTGFILRWENTRTSNVILRKDIFDEIINLFNPAFGRGCEDKDFFYRMIERGYIFIWCAEAHVYETVPPVRYKRLFMLKRALLRGKVSILLPTFGAIEILKSLTAIPVYTLALPFLLLIGHHIFMDYLIRDFDHIGKLLAVFGLDVIKQKYVMK